MARGVNKVILVGTCGQDPEVRYLPNGNAVTNLSLATSEQWTDKQTGQKVERTEWHRVSMFGMVARSRNSACTSPGSNMPSQKSFLIQCWLFIVPPI